MIFIEIIPNLYIGDQEVIIDVPLSRLPYFELL